MKSVAILCVLLLLSGCITREVVGPEALQGDFTKEVLVTTKMGTSIRMYAGQYRVLQVDTTKYVRGKGTVIKEHNQIVSIPFEGQIAFSEIVELETREKTPFYYSGYYIFGGAAVLFVLIILITRGPGPGG